MPSFVDVNSPAVDDETETLLKEHAVLPLASKHLVYPLCGTRDPLVKVMINNKVVVMLLDTGAHVSVIPKSLLPADINPVCQADQSQRVVRAFGGQEIELDGPVHLPIHICGLNIVYPFYYLDSDIPIIGGNDLLCAAKLVINSFKREVYSMHPAASERVSWQTAYEVEHTYHDKPTFRLGVDSQSSDDSDNDMSPQASSETCVTSLNPEAVPFQPAHSTDQQVTENEADKPLPAHVNLLYEATVANTRLTADVDQQFQEILHKHANTFATDSTDLGYCSLLEHDIDTGDSPPIKQSPRRPPLSAGDAENEIIDEMLSAGVIEPSLSEWASPVCLVKKPDGSYRFCIDYRRVNAVSRKDGFPIPDITEAIDSLRGSRWFATIDLLSGYWQLGMTDRAKERSAFCTRRGLFQFKRMPFGLCGAPATFCRLMSSVLGDYIGVLCLCYLDDVIVFAKTQRELLERLDKIFTRLSQYGLKIKPSKCVLFRTKIEFLGHLVTPNGVEPLPDKVKAIKEWPTPRCLRDVRAFYGLIGYYRKFVAGFATLAEPLTRLTKKTPNLSGLTRQTKPSKI